MLEYLRAGLTWQGTGDRDQSQSRIAILSIGRALDYGTGCSWWRSVLTPAHLSPLIQSQSHTQWHGGWCQKNIRMHCFHLRTHGLIWFPPACTWPVVSEHSWVMCMCGMWTCFFFILHQLEMSCFGFGSGFMLCILGAVLPPIWDVAYRHGLNCWYPSLKEWNTHNGPWNNLKLTKVINKNELKIDWWKSNIAFELWSNRIKTN